MSRVKQEKAPPGTATFHNHRQEFQDYLPLVQRVQEDLNGVIAELQAQEGWDQETVSGVQAWTSDTNTLWRVLRVSLAFSCGRYMT